MCSPVSTYARLLIIPRFDSARFQHFIGFWYFIGCSVVGIQNLPLPRQLVIYLLIKERKHGTNATEIQAGHQGTSTDSCPNKRFTHNVDKNSEYNAYVK